MALARYLKRGTLPLPARGKSASEKAKEASVLVWGVWQDALNIASEPNTPAQRTTMNYGKLGGVPRSPA